MAVGLGRAVPAVPVVEDDATARMVPRRGPDRGLLRADLGRRAPRRRSTPLAGARPDAALIDVGLPGMSGLDLISAIRDGPRRRGLGDGLPILLHLRRGHPPRRGPGHRARRATTTSPSPSTIPSSWRGSARSSGAPAGPTVARGGPGRRAGDRPARRRRHPRRAEARPLRQGVRAPRRAGPRPGRVLTRASCCATCGATAPPRGRARLTVTPAACAASSRPTAAAERWVANVRGIGYRLLPEGAWMPALAALRPGRPRPGRPPHRHSRLSAPGLDRCDRRADRRRDPALIDAEAMRLAQGLAGLVRQPGARRPRDRPRLPSPGGGRAVRRGRGGARRTVRPSAVPHRAS